MTASGQNLMFAVHKLSLTLTQFLDGHYVITPIE